MVLLPKRDQRLPVEVLELEVGPARELVLHRDKQVVAGMRQGQVVKVMQELRVGAEQPHLRAAGAHHVQNAVGM